MIKSFILEVLDNAAESLLDAEAFLGGALDYGRELLLGCHQWIEDHL